MKTIIAKVQVQFDLFGDVSEEQIENAVMTELNRINVVLQHANLDSQPQVFCNNIDSSDIEVATSEDEQEEEK